MTSYCVVQGIVQQEIGCAFRWGPFEESLVKHVGSLPGPRGGTSGLPPAPDPRSSREGAVTSHGGAARHAGHLCRNACGLDPGGQLTWDGPAGWELGGDTPQPWTLILWHSAHGLSPCWTHPESDYQGSLQTRCRDPGFLRPERRCSRFVAVAVLQSLSPVWLFATPWTTARQVPLSFTISRSHWHSRPLSPKHNCSQRVTSLVCILGSRTCLFFTYLFT